MANSFEMTRHTEAKHSILRLYLEHWFPILSSRGEGLAYIDGFAGPGVYSKGEPGSPIIALETANMYSGKRGFSARFWFIEPNPEHHKSLVSRVSRTVLREGIRAEQPIKSKFEDAFPGIIEQLRNEHGMTPTFAFIDPSGYSGVRMSTLASFLQNPRCELMFTLMDGFLKRFSGLPEAARKKTLDELFGTADWADAKRHSGPRKTKFLLDLFVDQLKRHNVKHTQTFEMCDENEQTIYHLVFATNNKLGIEKMKESMVRVDKKFTFRTSDAQDPNQDYFFSYSGTEWHEQTAKLVFRRFAGKTVTLSAIKWFVILETPYIYRAGILATLKSSGKVIKSPRRATDGSRVGLKRTVTFEKSSPVQTRLFQDS